MAKKKKDEYNVDFKDAFDSQRNVASSTDCTGLIPSPPINDEESNSYTDLNSIPKPRDHKRDV